MESFKDVFEFYINIIACLKQNGKQIPFYFNFEFKEPTYFEISKEMQSKIFKYIQDRKWGIQNEKIDVKELEFLDDPFVKEEKKFELSIENDEVNEDSD